LKKFSLFKLREDLAEFIATTRKEHHKMLIEKVRLM
jgi:hypothetical protein